MGGEAHADNVLIILSIATVIPIFYLGCPTLLAILNNYKTAPLVMHKACKIEVKKAVLRLPGFTVAFVLLPLETRNLRLFFKN